MVPVRRHGTTSGVIAGWLRASARKGWPPACGARSTRCARCCGSDPSSSTAPPGAWPRRRRWPTCAGWPGGACPAACSTTSTARPRTSWRWPTTAQAYRRIFFRPRVLRDVSNVDPSTTLLGKPIPYPLVLAPTGFGRIADPEGELAVARAAGRAGLPYTLSTLGTRSIEEIGARRRRAQVLPGVRVARPRAWSRTCSTGPRRPASRRSWSPSTPPCSASATATCDEGSRCHPRSVSTP